MLCCRWPFQRGQHLRMKLISKSRARSTYIKSCVPCAFSTAKALVVPAWNIWHPIPQCVYFDIWFEKCVKFSLRWSSNKVIKFGGRPFLRRHNWLLVTSCAVSLVNVTHICLLQVFALGPREIWILRFVLIRFHQLCLTSHWWNIIGQGSLWTPIVESLRIRLTLHQNTWAAWSWGIALRNRQWKVASRRVQGLKLRCSIESIITDPMVARFTPMHIAVNHVVPVEILGLK